MTRELPKWCQMIVTGKSVTRDQAKDIILRTDHFLTDPYEHAGGNFRQFNKAYRERAILNLISESTDWRHIRTLRERIGFVNTYFVENDWASSSFVYGPHGWCHPTGEISYIDNVGKWPDTESLMEDWQKLATAFPYLDLHVTIMNGESMSEDVHPLFNIRVVKGKAERTAPDLSVHGERNTKRSFDEFILDNSRNELGLPIEWYGEFADRVRAELEEIGAFQC